MHLSPRRWVATLNVEVISQASSLRGRHNLFILHYASHTIAAAPSNMLIITSRIGQKKFRGPQMSMTYLRDRLILLAADTEGLNILIMLDCCCAAIARWSKLIGSKRVELMAATSPAGISNLKQDHPDLTFTQHWSAAFKHYPELGHPFNCENLRSFINAQCDLEQFSALYILLEEMRTPITFRPPATNTVMCCCPNCHNRPSH